MEPVMMERVITLTVTPGLNERIKIDPCDSGGIPMRFQETEIEGVRIVELERFSDERGFFAEAFQMNKFGAEGLETRIAQTNVSYNRKRGVIRGLHFQSTPKAQAKLVRCTRGSIFDVAIDIRPGSPTFKRWVGVTLTDEDRRMLYLPAEGMAHGYQALEDDTEVEYLAFELWSPENEGGYRFDDEAFGVEWPILPPIVSEKDASWEPFQG
jgi:dTDP-4-dehydrorhamnose 3,5-epimerase